MGEKKEHKTYLLLDAKIAKDFHEQAMKKAEYPYLIPAVQFQKIHIPENFSKKPLLFRRNIKAALR